MSDPVAATDFAATVADFAAVAVVVDPCERCRHTGSLIYYHDSVSCVVISCVY